MELYWSSMSPRKLATLVTAAVFALSLGSLASPAGAGDLSQVDLSGAWYALIHYKDSKSEDKSLEKFKDFAWLVEQGESKIKVEEFPYVIFDEGSEELRRFAMRAHKPWAPEGPVLSTLRKNVDVSSRAMRKKTLEGSTGDGFKSKAPMATGAMTMSFSRNWSIDFGSGKIRIKIIDSLSAGSDMLGDIEEAIVYEITEQTADGDLVGTYAESTKSGKRRLLRSGERRVIK